jgi:hypothetical protein
MADDKDALPCPAQWQVIKEAADAGDGLPPALPSRVRPVQMVTPAGVQFGRPPRPGAPG